MRKLFLVPVVAVLFAGVSLAAADGKKVSLKGEGQCAKCSLKETKSCQNAVVVEKDGKKTTYYLAKNDVSNKFHKNICTEAKAVKVEGTCKEEDGKLVVTATSIEEDK